MPTVADVLGSWLEMLGVSCRAPTVAMALSDHHDVKICLSVYRAVDDEELLRAVGR